VTGIDADKVHALLSAAKAVIEECGYFCDDPERHDCEFVNTSSEGTNLLKAIQAIDSTYAVDEGVLVL